MQFPASENTNRIEPQKTLTFSDQKYVCNVCCVLSLDQPPQTENHTLHTLHFQRQIYDTFEHALKYLTKLTSLIKKKNIIFANAQYTLNYKNSF